jgi:hypothetical protein
MQVTPQNQRLINNRRIVGRMITLWIIDEGAARIDPRVFARNETRERAEKFWTQPVCRDFPWRIQDCYQSLWNHYAREFYRNCPYGLTFNYTCEFFRPLLRHSDNRANIAVCVFYRLTQTTRLRQRLFNIVEMLWREYQMVFRGAWFGYGARDRNLLDELRLKWK